MSKNNGIKHHSEYQFRRPLYVKNNKRQPFYLTTVDFWPDTLLSRTQQVRNSMIRLTIIHRYIHFLNMYIPDWSSVRFEPASKMDASSEDFDILVFGYLVICLFIFLVCFITFSLFFCVICLGFSIEDLKCCCHKAHKAFQYEECQLKAIETGIILLIHQLTPSLSRGWAKKRALTFLSLEAISWARVL